LHYGEFTTSVRYQQTSATPQWGAINDRRKYLRPFDDNVNQKYKLSLGPGSTSNWVKNSSKILWLREKKTLPLGVSETHSIMPINNLEEKLFHVLTAPILMSGM
jgi:hypothetical protein